jgi:hypothetical protein
MLYVELSSYKNRVRSGTLSSRLSSTKHSRGFWPIHKSDLSCYNLDHQFSHWLLLFGRLSDILGRKWMVTGTSVLGLLGCIEGGIAKNIDTLVGANLMNGIVAAGQLSFGYCPWRVGAGQAQRTYHCFGLFFILTFLPVRQPSQHSHPWRIIVNHILVFEPIIACTFISNTTAGWCWS